MIHEGLLIVFSAPSGTGKGTVRDALLPQVPALQYSISATTRTPRPGEKDGVHYHFVDRFAFERMIENGELLEWANVYGNYYGTPQRNVKQAMNEGNDVLLEIEPQGAMQVKQKFPKAIFVFLVPPSLEELGTRIRRRGTETDDSIRIRLGAAREEMRHMNAYNYVVVNDYVEIAAEKVKSIIEAEHCNVERCLSHFDTWLDKEAD